MQIIVASSPVRVTGTRLAAWWNCGAGDGRRVGRRWRGKQWAVRQGRPTDRTIEAELRTVVGHDSVEVIAPGLNQRLDRLEHLDRSRGAEQSGATADVEQVEPEGLERLGHLGTGLSHASCRGDPGLVGSGDLRGDLILHLEQSQCRSPMLRLVTSRDRNIREAKVLDLPEEADRRVAARSEIPKEAVLAAAETAAGVTEGQTGDEGTSRACFSRSKVAWTSSCDEASSGRWRSPWMIISSSGVSSARTRNTDSAGSIGASTWLGSSTRSWTSLVEATSN